MSFRGQHSASQKSSFLKSLACGGFSRFTGRFIAAGELMNKSRLPVTQRSRLGAASCSNLSWIGRGSLRKKQPKVTTCWERTGKEGVFVDDIEIRILVELPRS